MKSTFLNIHLFTFHVKCHNYCHKYYTGRIVIGCLSLLHKSIIFSLSPTVCHMDSCGINCDILCGLKIFVSVHILSHYLLGCQLLIGLYYLHMGSLIKVLPITNWLLDNLLVSKFIFPGFFVYKKNEDKKYRKIYVDIVEVDSLYSIDF